MTNVIDGVVLRHYLTLKLNYLNKLTKGKYRFWGLFSAVIILCILFSFVQIIVVNSEFKQIHCSIFQVNIDIAWHQPFTESTIKKQFCPSQKKILWHVIFSWQPWGMPYSKNKCGRRELSLPTGGKNGFNAAPSASTLKASSHPPSVWFSSAATHSKTKPHLAVKVTDCILPSNNDLHKPRA